MKLALASTPLLLLACGSAPKPQPVEPPPPAPVTYEDEDEDDGLDVVSSRGRMDPAVAQAGIEPHAAELSSCYTSKVGTRRWLGGKVTLHWDITREGEVTAVKLAESDLGAWEIEKCLLEVARTATFGKPKGGDADFEIPLEFSKGGSTVQWDEDQALRAVGGQVATLDACAKGKVAKPDDVTLTLYVGPQGKAQSVGFASAKTVLDDEWATCAEKAAMSWRLPDPKGRVAKLAVKYRAAE